MNSLLVWLGMSVQAVLSMIIISVNNSKDLTPSVGFGIIMPIIVVGITYILFATFEVWIDYKIKMSRGRKR